MTPAQILQLQLQVFEEYLNNAIRLGIPKVYIIHGLGKGRLRNDIQKRLSRNPYVRMFQNQHHHKYGFGATEVFLD
jgi:dsDNA-specific endonuclease/ATPase MutS2